MQRSWKSACSAIRWTHALCLAAETQVSSLGDASTACSSGFGCRWSALQGVAHLGEDGVKAQLQRRVLAMGEQEVALDVEGLAPTSCMTRPVPGTTTVMSFPLKTSTRVEASPGTP